jgi:hypothetical protein
MFRSIVFLALAGGVALGAWSSFSQEENITWESVDLEVEVGEPQVPGPAHPAGPGASTIEEPLHFVSAETIEAIRCGPWDVSAAGMEAILDEMIRRGWTPPTRAVALANLRPQFASNVPLDDMGTDEPEAPRGSDLKVEAVEPDERVLPFGPSRQSDGDQPPRYTN